MSSIAYAFGLYLLGALVVTFPLILSIDHALSDPVDAVLNTWIMAFEHRTLLTYPLGLLDTNIFYPYTRTLLFSETLLLPSLLLLPVRLATGNAVFTHNVLVLMGLTFTATSGYLLGRWLFHSFWPALAVGAVLAFNSYTLSNLGQAQLLHLEWLPLALLYTGKLLQRPTRAAVLLMACLLAAQFYTVIYYGIFSFLLVALVGGVWLLFGTYPHAKARGQSAGAIALAGVIALALCLPLAIGYYTVSTTYGFGRELAETWPYAASLETWTTARPGNLLYGQWLSHELPKLGFYPLDALFPGLILLLLAGVGLLVSLWRAASTRQTADRQTPDHLVRGRLRPWPLFLVAGIAFFLLLSLGPYPQRQSLQPDFDQLLPYAWVHAWVPGFQALRAPVRFAVIVFFGLALAAGYALRVLRWRLAQIGLFLLLLLEAFALPLTALYTPTISADQQAAYAWMATLPPTTYLEYPLYPFGDEGTEERWLESQFQSLRHWQTTPIGYSGFFPPRYEEFVLLLQQFPRPEVRWLLQAMGVEWVIIHRARLTTEEWRTIEQAITEHNWHVQQWGDVWAIQLPTDAALPVESRYVIPDVAQAGGTLAIGVVYASDEATPLVPASALGQLQVEWWRDDQRALTVAKTVQPPFFVDRLAVASFTVPVPAQPALYDLRVFVGEEAQAALQSRAAGMVNVVSDVAPPEATLLPVRGVEAMLVCEGETVAVHVLMQTSGWYDESFTLSARLYDAGGQEVARSAADVEFPAVPPRRNLLRLEPYTLPLDAGPELAARVSTLELVAYLWQQAAERIVPRLFVNDEGLVVPALTLPLTLSPSCGE